MKDAATPRSLVNLLPLFEEIVREVKDGYAAACRVQDELTCLAYLRCLSDEMARVLGVVDELHGRNDGAPVLPLPRADPPIEALREYRATLLERQVASFGIPDDEDLRRLRAQLVEKPAPGQENIEASQLLTWYLQRFIHIQTLVTAAIAPGLPTQTIDDYIDEAARARLPEAASNTTLAHLRLMASGDEKRDLGAERKDVERRRQAIDRVVVPHIEQVRAELTSRLNAILAVEPPESELAARLREAITRLNDPADPLARELTKRSITAMMAPFIVEDETEHKGRGDNV